MRAKQKRELRRSYRRAIARMRRQRPIHSPAAWAADIIKTANVAFLDRLAPLSFKEIVDG